MIYHKINLSSHPFSHRWYWGETELTVMGCFCITSATFRMFLGSSAGLINAREGPAAGGPEGYATSKSSTICARISNLLQQRRNCWHRRTQVTRQRRQTHVWQLKIFRILETVLLRCPNHGELGTCLHSQRPEPGRIMLSRELALCQADELLTGRRDVCEVEDLFSKVEHPGSGQ